MRKTTTVSLLHNSDTVPETPITTPGLKIGIHPVALETKKSLNLRSVFEPLTITVFAQMTSLELNPVRVVTRSRIIESGSPSPAQHPKFRAGTGSLKSLASTGAATAHEIRHHLGHAHHP